MIAVMFAVLSMALVVWGTGVVLSNRYGGDFGQVYAWAIGVIAILLGLMFGLASFATWR